MARIRQLAVFEHFFDGNACPANPAFHRTLRDTADFSDFLIRHAANPREDENFPLIFRKQVEGAQYVGKFKRLVLRGRRRQDAFGRDLVIFAVETPAASFTVELIAKDSECPGFEIGARLIAVASTPSLQQRFLRQIVSPISATAQ